MKGPAVPAFISPKASDTAVAAKLWEVSQKLTGVTWPTNVEELMA